MTPDSRTLYATLLGLKAPWEIEDVAMDRERGEVCVRVALPAKTRWVCPDCLKPAPIHDHQARIWRHLDENRGSPTLLQQSLSRDALGRVTDITETAAGASGPENRTTHYDYAPDTGWLTRVVVNGVQVNRYEYDSLGVGNGNRTAEYGVGDALVASAGYDAQDRLTSYGDAAYDWSAAGELRERNRPGERLTTTYDALGNLLTATVQPLVNGSPVGAPPATTVGYRVDGESRRVARSVNGVRERGWLYRDGISPVA